MFTFAVLYVFVCLVGEVQAQNAQTNFDDLGKLMLGGFAAAIIVALAFTFVLWHQRREMRRSLAQMDARSLRDAGISPAAAAYESGKPFWTEMGPLR